MNSGTLRAPAVFFCCRHSEPHEAIHNAESGGLLIAGCRNKHHPASRTRVAPSVILPAMADADCFRFRPRQDRLKVAFAALQLAATAVDASSLLSTSVTRQNTNLQSTESRATVIPPMGERCVIAHHIGEQTTSLFDGRGVSVRDIALLREYRTRLIADAVTGTLDVREAEE
jgi:hypothetical protein